MGKKRHLEKEISPEHPQPMPLELVPSFFNSTTALDPTLTSLFAKSSGPVTAPVLPRPSKPRVRSEVRGHIDSVADEEVSEDDDEATSSTGASDQDVSLSDASNDSLPDGLNATLDSPYEAAPNSRKRKRKEDSEDIESVYMRRLVREEAADERRRLSDLKISGQTRIDSTTSTQPENRWPDHVEDDTGVVSGDELPQHEVLNSTTAASDQAKTARTVFLGNVSTQAIKSKLAKKILISHLTKPLKRLPEHNPPHKIDSIRFRSTAFDVTVGPKKAAFAKKGLMDSTTKSTNAYVVYSTELAAKNAVAALNGTVVLDRHLRVDKVDRPAKIDNRRCVFVGNLGFVNEEAAGESSDEGDAGEKKPKRQKAKEPADAEEGLWRTFGKVGPVESVRVVRDKSTRIGKGIAYVQFEDENAVEAALLYNDKKFPPLLPRKLRVSRARRIRKHDSGFKSREGVGITKSGPKQVRKFPSSKPARRPDGAGKSPSKGLRRPEAFVFEGYRARKSDGKPKLKGRARSDAKSGKGKPATRSSRRGAAFKAGGKKKAHDKE